MLDSQRITPNKAMDILTEHDIKLKQGSFVTEVSCCAAGMVLVDMLGISEAEKIVAESWVEGIIPMVARTSGLDPDYLAALEAGFEDRRAHPRKDDHGWTVKGWNDGVALKLAVDNGTLPGLIQRNDNSTPVDSPVDDVVPVVDHAAEPHQVGALN